MITPERALSNIPTALHAGDPYELRLYFQVLASAGLFTRRWLQQLTDGCTLPARTRKVVEEYTAATLVTQPSQAGAVWLALLEETPGNQRVVLRKLTCRVSCEPVPALVPPSLECWSKHLGEIVESVQKTVVKFAGPTIASDWAKGRIEFDILTMAGQSDPSISPVSEDRSYGLVAAVALISAAFDVPLPPGTVALGMVSPEGRIFPLDADALAIKCKGLRKCLPILSTVFTAEHDEGSVRDSLPEWVNIWPIGKIRQLPELLVSDASRFRGLRAASIVSRVATMLAYLFSFGLGTPTTFAARRQKQQDGARWLLGDLLGGYLTAAVICSCLYAAALVPVEYADLASAPTVSGRAIATYVLRCFVMFVLWCGGVIALFWSKGGREFMLVLALREHFGNSPFPNAESELASQVKAMDLALLSRKARFAVLPLVFTVAIATLWIAAVMSPVGSFVGMTLVGAFNIVLNVGFRGLARKYNLKDREVVSQILPRTFAVCTVSSLIVENERLSRGTWLVSHGCLSLMGLVYGVAGLGGGPESFWRKAYITSLVQRILLVVCVPVALVMPIIVGVAQYDSHIMPPDFVDVSNSIVAWYCSGTNRWLHMALPLVAAQVCIISFFRYAADYIGRHARWLNLSKVEHLMSPRKSR